MKSSRNVSVKAGGWRFRIGGAAATMAMAAALVGSAPAIAAPPPEDMMVLDYDKAYVLRYDATTGGFIDVFVTKRSGGLFEPQFAVFGPHDGHLYVSSGHFSGRPARYGVMRYDGGTGDFIDVFTRGARLHHVHGVVFGPDGNLYVSDSGGSVSTDEAVSRILRYQGPSGSDPGAFMDVFLPPGTGGLRQPQAVLFGPDGNGDGSQDLYVASAQLVGGNDKGGHGSVKRFDGVTGAFLDDVVPEGSDGLDLAVNVMFRTTDPMTLTYP